MRTIKRAGDLCFGEHGTYRLEVRLGAGGMGEVWEGVEIEKGWKVAVKVMHEDGVAARQRFRREARLLRSALHPNIVKLLDDGETEDGKPCLVLELLSGQTLSSWLRKHGALPIRTAVHLARDVASALAAAHDQDIVHRDLKPGNVFLHDELGTSTGTVEVKVLDFGIAKDLSASDQTYATAVGVIIGSPGYMSPEQARGKEVDLRADIWTFGMLLFEMIEGRRMFYGSRMDLVRQVLSASIPPLPWRTKNVPPEVNQLVASCLERDPDKRIRNAREIEQELTRILESKEVWERPMTTEQVPCTRANPFIDPKSQVPTHPPTVVTIPEPISISIEAQTRIILAHYRAVKRQLVVLNVGIAALVVLGFTALLSSRSGPTFNIPIHPAPANDAAPPPPPKPPGPTIWTGSGGARDWFMPKL